MPDPVTHLQAHLALCATALALASFLAIPLGAAAARRPGLRSPILTVVNVARVVPSLAILTLVLPFLGLGFRAAVAALTLLAIPPLVINTDLGFRAIPQATRDAARGLGMTSRQMLIRVEWPLAVPIVFAGFRTATVEVIASATLAAFIGGGGLGEYIINGLANDDESALVSGGLAIAGLALLAEFVLGRIARRLASNVL